MPADTHNRPVIFGEVLFDHFPDNSTVLGGAPFNVAWHLQAFGQAPLFVSAVGDDALGHAIVQAMDNWGLDRSGLQQDTRHPTGTVEVHIENDEPSYEIVSERAYDFIAEEKLPVTSPGLLYHGTLALRNAVSAAALSTLKQAEPAVFLDVNLRPPWWNRQAVIDAMASTTWIKLNEDEFNILFPSDQPDSQNAEKLLNRYNLDLIILTCGSKGAQAFNTAGESITVRPEADSRIVDSVGAGDAFTSVIITGLLQQWPLEITLQRAQAFASAIVGIRGATTRDRDFYKNFTIQWGLSGK